MAVGFAVAEVDVERGFAVGVAAGVAAGAVGAEEDVDFDVVGLPDFGGAGAGAILRGFLGGTGGA